MKVMLEIQTFIKQSTQTFKQHLLTMLCKYLHWKWLINIFEAFSIKCFKNIYHKRFLNPYFQNAY